MNLHTTGARQRGRRARHRAHQPGAAGGDRGPAGPASSVNRAVPRRRSLRGSPATTRCGCTSRRREDVPSAVARAWHEATDGRGPAVVIVPMGDWDAPAADVGHRSRRLRSGGRGGVAAAGGGAGRPPRGRRAPALVVGADADDADAWAGPVALAERLAGPVWQEAFGARAGFPQDHPLFAGHLPAGPGRLRAALAGTTSCWRSAPRCSASTPSSGPADRGGHAVVVIDDVADEPTAARCSSRWSRGRRAPVCAAVARRASVGAAASPAAAPAPPGEGEPLRAAHVLEVLASRLPPT